MFANLLTIDVVKALSGALFLEAYWLAKEEVANLTGTALSIARIILRSE